MSEKSSKVTKGSGNVFADFELPAAEEHARNAALAQQIEAIIRQRKLTRAAAAGLLGLSQPDVSRLLRGHFRDYSLERLLKLLMALDRDIEIVIKKAVAAPLEAGDPCRLRKVSLPALFCYRDHRACGAITSQWP